MPLTRLTGGCHCGRVRFGIDVDLDAATVLDCDCSICRKKGFLHLIVPPDRFTLLAGDDALTRYTFGTGTAQHLFCATCGIHAFYRPRSHPESYDVNVRCLDDAALAATLRIEPFHGADWERSFAERFRE
jgi:hypothetical protein